jgi:hypothetical protein
MMHVIDAVLGSFSNLFRSHRYSPVEKLYSVVVYDLGGLPGIYLKTLYANYVLTTLYRRATRAGMEDGLRTLVIAEELRTMSGLGGLTSFLRWVRGL